MGILDKLQFWKKDEIDDLGPLPEMPSNPPMAEQGMHNMHGGGDLGIPEDQPFQGQEMRVQPSQMPPGMEVQQQPIMQPTQLEPKQDFMISKDLEVINAKLDSIKSTIDSMNQRLSTIERQAEQGQFKKAQW